MKRVILLTALLGLVFVAPAQQKKAGQRPASRTGKSTYVRKKKAPASPAVQQAYDPQPVVHPDPGPSPADTDKIYSYVDVMPEFPGGQTALMQFLGDRLQYPEDAREYGIEGKVIVQFVIDEQGNVSHATLMKDIGGGCGKEALRVVRSMPRWQPGRQNGKPVKVYYRLPVMFKLADEEPVAPAVQER